MKIIEIQGGLGNQLFLYTFWRWMQNKYPDEKIYGVYPSRALAAHNGLEIQRWFDVEMPPTSAWSDFMGNACFWLNKLFRRLHLPIPYCSDDIKPKTTAFFHEGYFQNLKYQYEVDLPKFREDLDLGEENKRMLELLKLPNAIAVHVRRGDYNKNSKNQRIYGGICTPEYYRKAIEKASVDISNPHFYFFSDDEEYVKQEFKVDNMTIVNINKGDRSFFDMYLMAHASNMILANSTFSCWAAYLNKNAQNVYCPSRMTNSDVKNIFFKKTWSIINCEGDEITPPIKVL